VKKGKETGSAHRGNSVKKEGQGTQKDVPVDQEGERNVQSLSRDQKKFGIGLGCYEGGGTMGGFFTGLDRNELGRAGMQRISGGEVEKRGPRSL